MIIQALSEYYQLLRNDPETIIPEPGYSMAKANFVVTISEAGDLLAISPLGDEELDWMDTIVPYQKGRTSNVFPYFLCDNPKYVFGWDLNNKKPKKKEKYFTKFKELHQQILDGIENVKGKAFLLFLDKWDVEQCLNHKVIEQNLELFMKSQSSNVVFKLDGETGLLHEDQEIKRIWEAYEKTTYDETWESQCLATGKKDLILKSHPTVSGVVGANTSGARLVSVDKSSKAFESYNKTQCDNSPIGKSAVFAYTTVLNYMLNTLKHRMQLGETTTVFWAEDVEGKCEYLMNQLLWPSEEEEKKVPDSKNTAYVREALQCLKEGKPIHEKANVNFYILGLSPNNARLAVRFWHRDYFGQFVSKVWQHHLDMEIINMHQETIPIYKIIRETVPAGSKKNEATPILGGALLRSIFTGLAYPQGLFYAFVNRIRADGTINDVRAGMIKAILKRKARLTNQDDQEELITVGLNEKNPNIAYRLGRLFAVLEKGQKDAAEAKLNSTIKDRFFGTASASPRAVFPVLMKLTQHHIAKSDYGINIDRKIQEILQEVDEFPAHLTSDEQGLFILGYYHQREALYQKKEDNKKEDNDGE